MTALEIIRFLRAERKRQKKSQKAVANHGEENGYWLPLTTLALYETERSEPSLTKVCVWARALGYELELVKKGAQS